MTERPTPTPAQRSGHTSPHRGHTTPYPSPTVRRYRQHWLWPVLDDDGNLDYWDIHHPDDPHGEGDPICEGLSTLADARAWVTAQAREDRWIRALDRLVI